MLIRTRRISLKGRLVAIVAGILGLGLVGGAAIILHNAREATLDEIQANLDFSQRLVGFFVADLSRPLRPDALVLLSRAFEDLRHVQVEIEDDDGRWRSLTPASPVDPAPAWFERLIVPPEHGFATIRFAGDSELGRIRISARTEDEIAEVWRDVYDLFWLAFWLLVAVCVLTYLGLWLGLKPLRDLHAGFARLAAGDFGAPVCGPAVAELADTQAKFNHVVGVLREATRERRLLTQKLVSMQEEERRAIARELHDEMAPYLFGIRTEIQAMSWALGRDEQAAALQRIDAVQEHVSLLQLRVKRLLSRLRPAVLDDFGLRESLVYLVEDWQRRMPATEWRLDVDVCDDDLSDAVRVTAYRAVQECLTNAARHSSARSVAVALRLVASGDERTLTIEVVDDGQGMSGQACLGLGLTGLRERIAALGGRFHLERQAGPGLAVRLAVPLAANQAD
ncbi:histidine kinase [Salinisphaera sp. T31B1]|uniref:histidine kinase n=1 Tax=Salinisphaera sp. T31B1 TaxID=727963 RepID=UPI0033423E01